MQGMNQGEISAELKGQGIRPNSLSFIEKSINSMKASIMPERCSNWVRSYPGKNGQGKSLSKLERYPAEVMRKFKQFSWD